MQIICPICRIICKNAGLLSGHPEAGTGTTFSDKRLKFVEQFPKKRVLMTSGGT